MIRIARTGLVRAAWTNEGVEAKHPDELVLDLIGRNNRLGYACVQQIESALRLST